MKILFTFYTLLFFYFTHSATFAQDQDIRWGGKVGLNLFSISEDPAIAESDAAVGSEFGIFARIGETLFVQPELNFVSNKVFLEQRIQNASINDGVVVRYMRFPVYLGYSSTYEGRGISHLRFMAGPSFGYALGVNENTLNIKRNDVRNAQFAFNGGAGIDLWLLSFDLIYHHSFSTFLNHDNAEGKGRSVALTAGISF